MEQETRNEKILKRVQISLAILASLVAVIVGAYNLKQIFFEKPAPSPAPAPVQPPASPDKLRAALEDVGASWIETLKKKAE